MFQFKQFAVDQTGCAMKINTDGVLLGALASANEPKTILDIGTGTGVIALMLAQRFLSARIDAIEIDVTAADTAQRNFKSSPFSDRLNSYAQDFEDFFQKHPDERYDVIVSNPPFYINSLKSPGTGKAIAKHANADFFEQLISQSAQHLTDKGVLWLVLPIETATLVLDVAFNYSLQLTQKIDIKSYPPSEAHRQILAFSGHQSPSAQSELVIYDSPRQYTAQYREVLRDFFTIF